MQSLTSRVFYYLVKRQLRKLAARSGSLEQVRAARDKHSELVVETSWLHVMPEAHLAQTDRAVQIAWWRRQLRTHSKLPVSKYIC